MISGFCADSPRMCYTAFYIRLRTCVCVCVQAAARAERVPQVAKSASSATSKRLSCLECKVLYRPEGNYRGPIAMCTNTKTIVVAHFNRRILSAFTRVQLYALFLPVTRDLKRERIEL